jgi:hypothetical protein
VGTPKKRFETRYIRSISILSFRLSPKYTATKKGDSEDECDDIAYACIVAHSDVFEIVALLKASEGFVALPAGQVNLHDLPYPFLDNDIYWANGQQHHRLFFKTLYHHKKQAIVLPRELYGKRVVKDSGLLFFSFP